MMTRALILGALLATPAQGMLGGALFGCGRIILLEAERHPFEVVFRAVARDVGEALTEYENTLLTLDCATHECGNHLQAAFPMQDLFQDIRLNLHGLAITLARFQRIDRTQGREIAMSAVDLKSAQAAMTYFLRQLALAKDLPTGDDEWNRDRESFLGRRSRLRSTLIRFRHLLAFFAQTEKTRFLIVVGEKIEGYPLIAARYSDWQARFLHGKGVLDESEKQFDDNERSLANYLREESRSVRALAEDPMGRNADALISQEPDKSEFKTFDPGADSTRVRNRVLDSLKKGGQGRQIVIDARRSGLTYEEAVRSGFRVAGLLKTHDGFLERLDELRIVGAGYDLIINYLSSEAFERQKARNALAREFQATMDERLNDAKTRMDTQFISEFLRSHR